MSEVFGEMLAISAQIIIWQQESGFAATDDLDLTALILFKFKYPDKRYEELFSNHHSLLLASYST